MGLHSEAFGNVPLEAMAAGTLIVTTRNDGALHLLNSEIAIFVDKASSSSLASGILEAINNPEAAFERSKNALELFKNHYTSDAVIPKVLSQCFLTQQLAKHQNDEPAQYYNQIQLATNSVSKFREQISLMM